MKFNRNKITAGALAALMLAGATGATLAYLSDAEKAVNTFTFGNVGIETEEPNWPGNDDPNPKTPNSETKKDPQMVNTGTSDAIVFMSVDSPLAEITQMNDDGTKAHDRQVTELFLFKMNDQDASDHTSKFASKWTPLTNKTQYIKITQDGAESVVEESNIANIFGTLGAGEKLVKRYVFGYSEAIQGSAQDGTDQTEQNKRTAALFDKVQVKNYLEGEVDPAVKQDVVVKSYGIQASNVFEGTEDLTKALDETKLTKIYNISVNQASVQGAEVRDADSVTNGHTNRWGTNTDVSAQGAHVKP